MKSVTIVVVLFFLPFSALAGTFLETFDEGDLEGWQEIWVDKESAFWEVVNDELRAESREGFIHLSFFSKKNLTMFLNYEKLLSILEKCVFESALTFHFGKVCDAKLCY